MTMVRERISVKDLVAMLANGEGMPVMGELTPLQEWMAGHRTEGWKGDGPPPIAKPRAFSLGKVERARLMKEFEVTMQGFDNLDRITAEDFEDWLEQKHSPAWKYKPYTVPKSAALTRLSQAERKAETTRVSAFIESRRKA